MADNYIDNDEIAEYSGYFLTQSASLVGASPAVDMEALRTMISELAARVRQELQRHGVSQSDLRSGRAGTVDAADLARQRLRQFRGYLQSLEGDMTVDVEAFFPSRRGGERRRRKPADLLAYVEDTLRGFDIPGASTLPERAVWQARLSEARDGLASSVGGKGAAKATSVRGTSELAAARREFLQRYGFAKSLVRALLKLQGRENELRLFFLDMQVNETGRPKDDEPADGEDTGEDTEGDDGSEDYGDEDMGENAPATSG